MSVATRPRVLAFAEDLNGLVTACRVHAPLITLKRLGLIDDYLVTDASMDGVPRDAAFDVVWLQRARDRDLALRLIDRLEGRFLLDMDDLLLARPSYIAPTDFPHVDHIRTAVRECSVLTVPSLRLAGLLADRGCGDLQDKAVVCPNALEFPRQPPRTPERPVGLMLTQSHRLALTNSRDAVLGAMRDFSAANDLPVYYFGPPPEVLGTGVADLLGPLVQCGYLDYWRYHSILAAWPAMIGLAPLETADDSDTLDFVAGKSDVKMVEFGGFGHPAVYSRATPYVDTDLAAGVLTDNTSEAWTEALEYMLAVGWRRSAVEQRDIVAARSLDLIARESWYPALLRARLAKPRVARELKPRGSVARRRTPRFIRQLVRRAPPADHVPKPPCPPCHATRRTPGKR